MKTLMIALTAILLPSVLLASVERYVKQYKLAKGLSAVVAEGELEPRSIGSYSVRLYRSNNPQFAADDFLDGIIRERNGTIEKVELIDIDGDTSPELVISIRNAGSGSYLAADAIGFKQDKITVIASVSDLEKGADVVTALRMKTDTKTKQSASAANLQGSEKE